MRAIKDFFSNLKYNTEGKVALASIIVNIILIIILLNIMCTGDVPGYTSRAELEAQTTECTLEHVDPNATTTTTSDEVTDETADGEDDSSSTTTAKNSSTKTTTKNNGGNKTTTKKTTTTAKTTTTTKNSGDNDVDWNKDWSPFV